MSRAPSSPIWPFAIVLTILFGMSLTAPRGWEAHAQRRSLEPSMTPAINFDDTLTMEKSYAARKPATTLPRTGGEVAATPSGAPSVKPTLNSAATLAAGPKLSNAPMLNGASTPGATPTKVAAPAAPTASFANVSQLPKLHGGGPAPASTVVAPAPASKPTASTPVASQSAPKQEPARPVVAPQVASSLATAPTAAETIFKPALSGAPQVAASAPAIGPRLHGAVAPTAPRIAAEVPKPAAPTPTPSAAPQIADRRADPQQAAKIPTGLEPRTVAPAPRPEVDVAPQPQGWWPNPEDLLARLQKLATKPETQRWADRASQLVAKLTGNDRPEAEQVAGALRELRALVADREALDENRLDRATALELRLTRYALQRRLDVWDALANVMSAPQGPTVATADDGLGLCLVDIERRTEAAGESGLQWRKYLLLDALDEAVRGRADPQQTRVLAREVLERIHRAEAQGAHNAFLHEGPFADLDKHLRHLAAQEIDARQLLASIEQFESGGRPNDARALAEQCRILEASTAEEQRQLAVWLTSHYRNANIRLTLSSDLLNRMMPDALRKNAPVRDTILGNPTHGWSTSRTGLSIRFLPSQDTLAVRFDAKGTVASQTQTSSGPVRLFSHSNATFAAYKDLTLATDGFHVTPAKAQTQSKSRLRGIRTDFDHMPILGNIVESMALDAHAENRTAAQNEASAKISRQVERGLDAEIDNHLDAADRELNRRLLDPLAKLGLAPEVIELQSNEQRAIVRMRVAGDDQLAAYTPRPRAYSDNVGSLQVHHSAINNILARGGLQGRSFTAAELFAHLATLLPLEQAPEMPELPEDVNVRFAPVDPVTVRCEEGHLELRLAIDELQSGTRTWRDFVVRVQLKPTVIEGRTFLTRDGLIRIAGSRLSTTSQISLRTAMAKVFPDDMRLDLWPSELAADPRFSDLTVAQVDLRDGWIALAVGPTRHFPSASLFPPRRR